MNSLIVRLTESNKKIDLQSNRLFCNANLSKIITEKWRGQLQEVEVFFWFEMETINGAITKN